MTDPNNPLNLLLTLETALHKSHKGRWPNNVRNAVQGLRRALAARFETPAGPVYGSIDACCRVQKRFAFQEPIDMVLLCPMCGVQHIDKPDAARSPSGGVHNGILGSPHWENPPHRSHLCHECGCVWRPADVATNGVESIETKGIADNFEIRRVYARGGKLPVQHRGTYTFGGIGFQATGQPCADCGAEAGERCAPGCPGLL
jgi:hypothetical protein